MMKKKMKFQFYKVNIMTKSWLFSSFFLSKLCDLSTVLDFFQSFETLQTERTCSNCTYSLPGAAKTDWTLRTSLQSFCTRYIHQLFSLRTEQLEQQQTATILLYLKSRVNLFSTCFTLRERFKVFLTAEPNLQRDQKIVYL